MKIPPLLRRTDLLTGESLASLLERLVHLNYYENSGMIKWICQHSFEANPKKDNIFRPKNADTFLHLSQLTMINEEQLFDSSDHRFASVITPLDKKKAWMAWHNSEPKQILIQISLKKVRSNFSAQFCPLCLKDSAYHRLSWVPFASLVCLQHQCLLIDQCLKCGKKVSVMEIVNKACKNCKADLTQNKPVSVADDKFGLFSQQVIQSWFSIACPSPLDYGLPKQHPSVLYHLLDKIRMTLLHSQDGQNNLLTLLGDQSFQVTDKLKNNNNPALATYYLYRTAFQVITDWPDEFFSFLYAYSRDKEKRNTHKATVLPQCFQNIWNCSDFQFLHETLLTYFEIYEFKLPNSMLKNLKDLPWFIQKLGLWTKERTAQELEVSITTLHRLLGSISFSICRWRQVIPQLFISKNVLWIKQLWKVGLPITHACCWFGFTKIEILNLLQLNILSSHYLSTGTNQHWMLIDILSIKIFFERVISRLLLYDGNKDDLIHFRKVSSVPSISSSSLLQRIADGLLFAYKCSPSVDSLDDIYFIKSMFSKPK